MRDFGWWSWFQERAEPAAADPTDPFPVWERELAPAADRRDLVCRLVIGALLGFLLPATVAIGWATIVLDQVFGTAGGYEPTAGWMALSMFGALLGGGVACAWPTLTRVAKRFTVYAIAVTLLAPGAAEYVEARTGHLSYGELHELAVLGGRSVCQIQLPARSGWPAGTYWMLNAPTDAGSLVTSHGGDRTWLHRYPAPMVCLD